MAEIMLFGRRPDRTVTKHAEVVEVRKVIPPLPPSNTRKDTPMTDPNANLPTLKDAAYGEIKKIAAGLRAANPQLNEAAAFAKALDTDRGQEWYAKYRSPDAHLRIDQWCASREFDQKYGRPDQLVDAAAKAIAKRDTLPFIDALNAVRTEFPALWSAYRPGR